MLIACVQSDVTFADTDSNLRRVIAWMRAAAGNAAAIDAPQHSVESPSANPSTDLVVFPECMLSGYCFESREHALQAALPLSSPVFTQISEEAGRLGQTVAVGFLECDGGRLFNASVLLDASGVLGHYRKIHLPHLGVDRFVDRGDLTYRAFPLSDSGADARVGLAICYDGSFPEPMRVLGLEGADVIALSTNWPNEGSRTADIVPPARAMENHLFFVAANRVGEENGVGFCGRSSICGPDGVLLASSPNDEECLLFAHIAPERARQKRIERSGDQGLQHEHTIDRFADRRPEFYGRLVSPVFPDRRKTNTR